MISLDDEELKNSASRRLFSLSKKESKVNKEDKDDNSDTLKIFLDCLKKSCSETTAHAIPNIERSEQFVLRFFWIVLFLIAIAASAYSIMTYLQYGVTVSVELGIESPLTFPAVTLCNLNAFDTSDPSIIETINLIQNLNLISKSSSDKSPNEYLSNIDESLKVFIKQKITESFRKNQTKFNNFSVINSNTSNLTVPTMTGSNTTSNSSLNFDLSVTNSLGLISGNILGQMYNLSTIINIDIGFKIKNMLLSCKFNGLVCNYTDFDEFYSFEYGNCYTFNKKNSQDDDLRKVDKTKVGLELEVFTGNSGEFSLERGVYVSVHNNSVIPLTKYEGTKVPVGTCTDIGVARTFRYKLDKPYSDCRKDISRYESTDSDYYKYILTKINNTQYSRRLCYEVCYQDIANSKCNCSDPTNLILFNANLNTCNKIELEECVRYYIKNCEKSPDDCQCSISCPLECDSVIYFTTQTSSLYPTEYYYRLMKNTAQVKDLFKRVNLTYDIFKNSVAKINVFYSDIYYTKISESPTYQPFDLLGLLGGVLGLFIGVSLMSFFEIVDFFMVFIYRLVNAKSKKNKIQSS